MPTAPEEINVELIDYVSNDNESIGRNEILTAEAVEGKLPAGPEVFTFDNGDLVADVLVKPYASGQGVVFYSMKDNADQDVRVPVEYDDAGTYVEFDFSAIGGIVGTWTCTLWTSTGPIGVTPPPIEPGENDTGNVRLEPISGDVDLKTVADHTVFTVDVDTLLAVEDLQIILSEAVGVSGQASVTLDVVGGQILVDNLPLPITQQYERHTFDVSGSPVIPAGSVLRFRVTGAGVATGNMVGKVNISAYVEQLGA